MAFTMIMLAILPTNIRATEKKASPESLVIEGDSYTVCTSQGFTFRFIDTSIEACQVLPGAKLEVLAADSDLTMVRLTQPKVVAKTTTEKPRNKDCPNGVRVAGVKSLGKKLTKQMHCQLQLSPELTE